MKQGRIVRVSGPLVVAEGMEDARMFDVVRVSDHRLIGEIIELRRDRASIQVYENTGGLGVGEPVVSTGEPLSVELGPGLMGSIYDGIQRPLDVIQAIAGDIITRGIEVPGLSREKEWHFVPKVEVGDKVIGGDVIGEVQETTLVTHKIMVPPNMEGEIVQINEGDYTVEDTVAKIKTANGIENIAMIQRWPVREPRPIEKNLPPRVPMFTGQRVIDALFPVGKGGTACVPGPFGSGKCVTGDTPVLLGSGQIKAIEQIFEQYKDKGQMVINQYEEYTVLDQPLAVFAYQNGGISRQQVRAVYKGKTDRILIIKTRTGRIAKVTPIHQLFRIDGDLNITETKAVDLRIGDYLVSPRMVEIPEQMQNIEIDLIEDQDKIVDIQEVVTDEPVYDLEVPQGHNFIGGISPMIFHNTVIQHQLAKWADAEIVVYVGCGERGNEMTDILLEFPELQDPKSGEPLMKRTVMIANTSNMPVAARDASVYTGVTIAEYFRDMGYSVAVMADSTSRWAEAMREISGRLEEMPGEEGYPAYLGTRIAEFYERAGRVICLGTDDREGALSIVGAVSPPGGDLSDPVVQATLRVAKVFWSLEDELAYSRHFPAISWLNSYSLYIDDLEDYFRDEVGGDWIEMREQAEAILQEEADLKEIVRLVGVDALSPENRLIMETAKSIREDFLHQNALHEVDTYTSFKKQYNMLELIMLLHQRSEEWLSAGKPIDDIMALDVKEEIARAKYIPEDNLDSFEEIKKNIISQTEV